MKPQLLAVLPPQFPDKGARIRMNKEYNALLQGTYLKKRARTLFLNAQLNEYRQRLSVALRRVTKRAIKNDKSFSFKEVSAEATVSPAPSTPTLTHVKTFSEQQTQVSTPCPHCFRLPSEQKIQVEQGRIFLIQYP